MAKRAKAKADSAATENKVKMTKEEYWKALLDLGFENGHLSGRSSGGITIVGIGSESTPKNGKPKRTAKRF